jgi:hypothetical protein
MQHLCEELHLWANSLPVICFPFNARVLPLNGIYLLFEKGETAHGTNRIVRVGTHTGNDQLPSRLKHISSLKIKTEAFSERTSGVPSSIKTRIHF